jgi:hypothetical protein
MEFILPHLQLPAETIAALKRLAELHRRLGTPNLKRLLRHLSPEEREAVNEVKQLRRERAKKAEQLKQIEEWLDHELGGRWWDDKHPPARPAPAPRARTVEAKMPAPPADFGLLPPASSAPPSPPPPPPAAATTTTTTTTAVTTTGTTTTEAKRVTCASWLPGAMKKHPRQADHFQQIDYAKFLQMLAPKDWAVSTIENELSKLSQSQRHKPGHKNDAT